MAYTSNSSTQRQGGYPAKKPAPVVATGGNSNNGGNNRPTKPAVFSTGLFKPKFEDAKNVAEVLVKEDITIPAGSRIKLFPVDADKQGEHGKLYTLQVK